MPTRTETSETFFGFPHRAQRSRRTKLSIVQCVHAHSVGFGGFRPRPRSSASISSGDGCRSPQMQKRAERGLARRHVRQTHSAFADCPLEPSPAGLPPPSAGRSVEHTKHHVRDGALGTLHAGQCHDSSGADAAAMAATAPSAPSTDRPFNLVPSSTAEAEPVRLNDGLFFSGLVSPPRMSGFAASQKKHRVRRAKFTSTHFSHSQFIFSTGSFANSGDTCVNSRGRFATDAWPAARRPRVALGELWCRRPDVVDDFSEPAAAPVPPLDDDDEGSRGPDATHHVDSEGRPCWPAGRFDEDGASETASPSKRLAGDIDSFRLR
jgi:hypothetical protein